MWRTAHFTQQHQQQQQWQVDDFATAAAAAAAKRLQNQGFLFLPFCQGGGMAIIHTRGGMRQNLAKRQNLNLV